MPMIMISWFGIGAPSTSKYTYWVAVVAYGMGNDGISVQFRDGWIYTYTYESAGHDNVEHMKTLASAGRGLNSFISGVVKAGYAAKSR
jgi:hypothetical protein